MPSILTQSLSLLGAFLILIAYAATQTGRMDPHKRPAALLNLIGSALLFLSALAPPNAGVLVLEAAWAAISLASLIRTYRTNSEATP